MTLPRETGRESTLNATRARSVERIVATAAGASVGALEANYFRSNLIAYAVAIFSSDYYRSRFVLEGRISPCEHFTLTSIVLIPRPYPPWSIGLHGLIEVPVGIIVALAVVALSPEHQRASPDSTAE